MGEVRMGDAPPRSQRELELEIQVLRLERRVRDLEDVVKQQSEGLKEIFQLLQVQWMVLLM